MPGQANNACLVYILFIVSYIAILPDSSVRWLIGLFFFFFFTYEWSTPEIKQLWSAGQIWLATHFCGVLLEHRYIHSSSLVCDCPGTTRVELSDWERPQNLKYLLSGHFWGKFLDLSSGSLTGEWRQLLAQLCFIWDIFGSFILHAVCVLF